MTGITKKVYPMLDSYFTCNAKGINYYPVIRIIEIVTFFPAGSE